MKYGFSFKIIFICLLAAMMIFTSCGGNDYSSVTPEPDAAAAALISAGVFSEELGRLDDDAARMAYGMPSASSLAVWSGSGATPEEIIIASGSDTAAIRAELEAHLSNRKTQFTDYNAWEKPKLNGALIFEAGSCVIYAVGASGSDSDVEKALIGYLDTLL